MNGPPPQTIYTPQEGLTSLVVEPSRIAFTAKRETDCRTALCRGLAEYLIQLSFHAPDGNVVAFKKAFATWPSPEDDGEYPSALVHTDDEGIYEASSFTPDLAPQNKIADPDDGRFVVTPNGFQLDMEVEVHSSDPVERKWLVAMLEDALDPVDWRSGALLELPHYFGQRATYKMLRMKYEDAADTAQEGLRVARVVVRGNVPQTRLQFTPQMIVRQNVVVGTAPLPASPNLQTRPGS
jgi:hypothetical protein